MEEKKDKNIQDKDYEDLKKKLKVILGLREKISTALDKVFSKGNLTPQELTTYLDNASNFTDNQYALIQKQRNEIQSFIWEALGENVKKKEVGKKLKKQVKKRRSKSLGHRRKWLQMD